MFGKYLLYALLLLFCAGLGYSMTSPFTFMERYQGGVLGLIVGSLVLGIGFLTEKFGTRRFLWGIFGFVLGVLVSILVNVAVEPVLTPVLGPVASVAPNPADLPHVDSFSAPSESALPWKAFSFLLFSYWGVILALKAEKDPRLFSLPGKEAVSNSKILDTSVIIDGRIADLCETGFLEGTFLIPQFVLHELQYVADSADSTRRVRGRRGLDILHRLQKMAHFDLRIIEDDFPSIREVDAKIVALARQISAKVVTNDLNLNKVAGLQGVTVLNINQLSHALKPVVLPGETMRLFVLKEGKESWQGVAYLDDGTMIVIDDGKRCIGKKVDVVVTSVLQTSAGRMIFAKLREEQDRETYVAAKTG